MNLLITNSTITDFISIALKFILKPFLRKKTAFTQASLFKKGRPWYVKALVELILVETILVGDPLYLFMIFFYL